MKKSEVDTIFSKLAEYQMIQKKAEKEIEALKSDIRAYMEKRGLTELLGKEHRATYKEISQTKLDRKRLEEEHPRIAKQYTIDSSYMRLNFS